MVSPYKHACRQRLALKAMQEQAGQVWIGCPTKRTMLCSLWHSAWLLQKASVAQALRYNGPLRQVRGCRPREPTPSSSMSLCGRQGKLQLTPTCPKRRACCAAFLPHVRSLHTPPEHAARRQTTSVHLIPLCWPEPTFSPTLHALTGAE